MSLEFFDDAETRCCWVEAGVRCEAKPVVGHPRQSACKDHFDVHRALTQEPGAELDASDGSTERPA